MAKKLGIKAIKKALSDCAIDPNKPGWMKIVSEAGNEYCVRRAMEALNNYLVSKLNIDDLYAAIGLLGLVAARNDRDAFGAL